MVSEVGQLQDQDVVWVVVAFVLVLLWTVSSIRLAIFGAEDDLGEAPVTRWKKILKPISPYWGIGLGFIFLAWTVGDFGRGETSPLFWRAYSDNVHSQGWSFAVFQAILVAVTDAWLFWIPAQMWIKDRNVADSGKRRMARTINILAGLSLVTEMNPVYWLVHTNCGTLDSAF